MSTPVKDPFDDLLDLGGEGDGDGPPPLPTTQPPQDDSWMVLSDGADDFNSVTEDDLFGGPNTTGSNSGGKRSGSKAHGTTFDDLFGEGSSDKKTKKSSTGHGATFDDLFGDDKSSKNFKNGSTTFEDLFPEECEDKPAVTSPSRNTTNLDDFFGSPGSKKSENVVSSENASSALDDLLGTEDKSSESYTSKKTEESLEDIFGSSAGKSKTADTFRKHSDSIDDLFGSPDRTKTSETPSKKSEEAIDDMLGSSSTKAPSPKPAEEIRSKAENPLDDLFGPSEKKSSLTKSSPGPTFEELFPEESSVKKPKDTFDNLFGSPKSKTKDSTARKTEKGLDDIFGQSTSSKTHESTSKKTEDSLDDLFGKTKERSPEKKTDKSLDDIFGRSANSKTDDLFGNNSSKPSVVSSADRTKETETSVKTSSTSSDLDDIFSSNTGKSVADDRLENGTSKDAKVNGSDTVDAKVDILISPVQETAKRTSSSDLGDQEGHHDDLDFSVIEDTSLLDPNITRHKSSLRKRGSLARRKKPTRSSIRRVHQQDEDPLSIVPTTDDKDKDEDETDRLEKKETPDSPSSRVKEEEVTRPVKKSPVAGGKLLIGPDILAGSKLMKGIASKQGRPSAVTKTNSDTTNGTSTSEPAKSEETHKPVIKPSKPQISPRPKLSPTSDLKGDNDVQSSNQNSKPDSSKVSTDNKESQKVSVMSTVLKPTPTSVSQSRPKVIPSVTLEKVALRSTRSGSSPPEPKITSPTADSNVVHSELTDRKNSLRRVSPAKNKESDEPKEEKKSQPTWLKEMKLRSSRNTADVASSKVTESKTPSSVKDDVNIVKVSSSKPAITPRRREVDSPKVSENKPQPSKRPVIEKPKPKTEASKPLLSVNGKGDAPSRSPLGGKENTSSSTDVPSWKRELAERKKKKKEDPVTLTPSKSEPQPDAASNWRTQLAQKKRRSVATPTGDAKASPDSKQPEWAVQAEQRRARLLKSGVLGQK